MSTPFFKIIFRKEGKLMDNPIMFLPAILMKQQSAAVLRECNDYTVRYGLELSEQEIGRLVENRKEALELTGRIEFGGGVIQKIIMEFADSGYMNQSDYADNLMELQECFYHFKSDAIEALTDDELIKLMKFYFEEICHGSVELLKSTMLENHCRDIRYGTKEYQKLNGYEDDYTDFLDWDEKEN
jgi:hypothetical protein